MNWKIKTGLLFVVSLLQCYLAVAQQDAQFTQSQLVPFYYNPSYAGYRNVISGSALFRTQWTQLTGHPVSQLIEACMPWDRLKGNVGLVIVNDFAGLHRNTRLELGYAKTKKIGAGMIAVGAKISGAQLSISGSKILTPDGIYDNGGVNHNDNDLPVTTKGSFTPDAAIGARFVSKKLNVGFSINHLVPLGFRVKGVAGVATIPNKATLYLNADYLITINSKINYVPAVLFKTDIAKATADFSNMITYNDFLFGGLGFRGYSKRSFDAADAMVGVKFYKNFRFSYSYDFNISALRSVNNGSHELLLQYQYTLPPPPPRGKIIYTPRFL